ncbi:TIGR03067 domain-containing protein [Humisphaera borealis]|uniref:TIGR03067 domain-containing protein n=1 Tax=Humisphaera borealis TaxID=2807512 RepID=A0A7M2X0L5_9BACT|nr:TIGR03067 domain-containing protein [Humisphaera borealis]QOV91225.1 TIGR03067 domain-containing protein [Humisphaera borealis]
MNRFKSYVACTALTAIACVAVAEKPTPPADTPNSQPDQPNPATKDAAAAQAMEAFSGGWDIAVVQPEGATKNASRLVFHKDGTYAAQDKEGKELWAGTFEIDATAKPMIWDHRSHDGRKTGQDVLGIYELTGDRLKVACVVGQWKEKEWVGKPRPTAIDLKHADVVIELSRAKAAK